MIETLLGIQERENRPGPVAVPAISPETWCDPAPITSMTTPRFAFLVIGGLILGASSVVYLTRLGT